MIRIRGGHWVVWVGLTAAATLLLRPLRGHLDKTHIALLYLLLVLAGSVAGGRRTGLSLAGAAFLLFNWFFLPPYGTFRLADPMDWLVLVAFLVVAAVAAQMVHRLRERAEEARRRTEEVRQLAHLGAETLNLPRSEEALAAIIAVIRSTLGVPEVRLHRGALPDSGDDLVAWVEQSGKAAARLGDGTTHLSFSGAVEGEGIRTLLLPLQVRRRTVGVLELGSDRAIRFDASQQDMLAALSYYAALAVERGRLEAEAAGVERLREADRLKDALLASVSHDLRTPLTTIKALATELADSGSPSALVIVEEADRLNRMVANLLDLSRLRGGALQVHPELVAVDDLVGAALQRLAGILGSREVRVTLGDGGSLLVGRFDFVHTLRILVNLIENAAKYSPASAPIDLAVHRVGDMLHVAVTDQGPGLPVSERERVFEPFRHAAGGAPQQGGAGLGLAISRSLAEAQGGALTYQPGPSGGSRFLLTLPAADLPGLEESL